MHRPLLLSLSTLALAAAVEVEAAKLATPDAMPVDAGGVEIAFGLSWSRADRVYDADGTRQDRGGRLTEVGAELGLTYGLREGLDAGITVGWARIEDETASPDSGNGPTDVVVGAKWQFYVDETLALALLPEASLPVGDGRPEEEISTGSATWGVGVTLAATAAIDRLALGAGLGRGWILGDDEDRGDARGAWAFDLAVGWQLTEAVQPEIELHHARDLNAGSTPDAHATSVTVGVQLTGEAGRLGLGLDRTIAGRDAEQATTLLLQAVTSF